MSPLTHEGVHYNWACAFRKQQNKKQLGVAHCFTFHAQWWSMMHNAHSCRSPGVLSYQHATCKTAHGCPVYVCICAHIVLQLCTSMNTCKPVSQFGMLDVEMFFWYFLSVAAWEVSFMEPCIRQGGPKGGCGTLSMRSFQILHHQHGSKHLQRPAGPTVDVPIVPTWFQHVSKVSTRHFPPTARATWTRWPQRSAT